MSLSNTNPPTEQTLASTKEDDHALRLVGIYYREAKLHENANRFSQAVECYTLAFTLIQANSLSDINSFETCLQLLWYTCVNDRRLAKQVLATAKTIAANIDNGSSRLQKTIDKINKESPQETAYLRMKRPIRRKEKPRRRISAPTP
jgi:hypothetical protein